MLTLMEGDCYSGVLGQKQHEFTEGPGFIMAAPFHGGGLNFPILNS